MLDAAKNAKSFGYFLFIVSLIGLINLLLKIHQYSFVSSALAVVISISTIIVSYGMTQKKSWSIYGLALLALYELCYVFYLNFSLNKLTPAPIVTFAIYLILFFWFYSAKSKFK